MLFTTTSSSRIWAGRSWGTFLQSSMKVLLSPWKLFYQFPGFCWQMWLPVGSSGFKVWYIVQSKMLTLVIWVVIWLIVAFKPDHELQQVLLTIPKYGELVDYNNFRRLEMKDSTPHSWANASDLWWTPAETPISMHSLTKINQDNLQQLALFRCKLVRLNRTRRQS